MLRAWILRGVVALGLVLFHTTLAFGRAGGGGGYSSGGGGSSSSSSSSSSGGSSGGGGDFTWFDALVVLVLITFMFVGKRQILHKHRAQLRTRRESSREWAARLREHDPRFDLEVFEERVRNAFLKIQDAWSSQDLGAVRGFMSDGLYERFSIQLREQRALGYRNRMSDVRIEEVSLIEARSRAHFDVVAVRITAGASDCRVDAWTGDVIQGSRRVERFSEVWSFLRSREASSVVRDGLFEGRCPNCAAPIDARRVWGCESCGSELRGAPPDWVLTEITQRGEWSSRKQEEPEWLKQATRRDPGLTEEQLEDRASVLFWRLMDSDRIGDVCELASVARPAFLERQADWLASTAGHYVGDCAVGSVGLRGLIPGMAWDLALIEVRWSGSGFERDGRGGVESTGGRSLRRHLLVMARRAGAQSDLGRCIVSAHCSGCGAPDEGALDGACGFCGEPLNDGRDWLIDRFLTMGESEAALLLAEAARSAEATSGEEGAALSEAPLAPEPSEPGGEELLGWCLALTYADEHLDPKEREQLIRLAERLGVSADAARKLTRAAQFDRLEVQMPGDSEEARVWLDRVVEIAEIDGRLDRRERAVLDALTQRAGGGAAPAAGPEAQPHGK